MAVIMMGTPVNVLVYPVIGEPVWQPAGSYFFPDPAARTTGQIWPRGIQVSSAKYAAALTGTSSPETVTHNLGTRDVSVTVRNGSSPFTTVEVDWDATTTNTVTLRFNPALGAGYRVIVEA